MKKKIPRQVVIGGVTFTVVVEDSHNWGECRFDKRQIMVSKDSVGEDGGWASLRHEMIHAALDIGGVAYNKRYEDESVVRCIENLFCPAWDKLVEK